MKHIALGELGTVPMIHFPKEMVSRSEKFGTVPVFQILRSATTTPLIRFICTILCKQSVAMRTWFF